MFTPSPVHTPPPAGSILPYMEAPLCLSREVSIQQQVASPWLPVFEVSEAVVGSSQLPSSPRELPGFQGPFSPLDAHPPRPHAGLSGAG